MTGMFPAMFAIIYRHQLTCGSSMMFNTGDIVRWREDGSLETFGRMDDQVKIKVCTMPLVETHC